MFDEGVLKDKLAALKEALQELQWRFDSVSKPSDFLQDRESRMRLDSISMMLIGVGETFKKIDAMTGHEWLKNYPEIAWRELIGMRDVLAHDYFGIDAEVVW